MKSLGLACLALVILTIVTAPACAKIRMENAVGLWLFDEGQGEVVNDISGMENHGSFNGAPEWTEGLFGGALNCATGGHVLIKDNDSLDLDKAWTVALWVNIEPSAIGTWQTILNKRYDIATNYVIRLSQDRIKWEVMINNGGWVRLSDPNPPQGGEWVHLAGTYDGADVLSFFVNGEQVATRAGTAPPPVNDIDLRLGSYSGSGGGIRGMLDETAIFNVALAPEDIRLIEEKGLEVALGIGAAGSVARSPNPVDQAIDVSRDVVLSWTPGFYAPAVNGHRVYLSESFSDVNDGVGGVTVSDSSYTPGRLAFSTTYYWRVDEVNAPPDSTVFRGDVWSFTTEPVGYAIDGANITATASSTNDADLGPEKTIDGSGLDENDLHSAQPKDMWLSGTEPSGAWIRYEFDRLYKLHEMWVWNSNQLFEDLFGFGFKDVVVEYSANGADWTTLSGVPEFARAPGAAGYAHNTTVDFGGAAAKVVRLTATSSWGDLLAQYGLSEVRFYYTPLKAREPSPDSGAADVGVNATLSWRAGREAATHNVYLSTDQQAVIDGTAPAVSVADASYSTTLDLGGTYYWRVDEVNEAETPTTWQGDIWDFTTQQFIVVEGFEDYNDYPPYEIYSTWLDGYENPTNGSQVGYLTPPAVEKSIVHGGRQSMPLLYSNTGGAAYSEAARTFAVGQDWTKYGIQTLRLHFYGTEGNTGQLYVKINGAKVPYDGDAGNLAVATWQSWNIDLTTLGVNLQNVTTLAIGIDGNAAAGTLYFDDIRLYAGN
jgi:hypothetical protein